MKWEVFLKDDCLLRYYIVLMMEAASTSSTSINVYKTALRNIPEDGHLHIRRYENLISQMYRYLSRKVISCYKDFLKSL
jgi:hypothetical protein